MSSQNIVIVGGGAAGATVARDLSAKLPNGYNLILVTVRECHVHMPALLRLAVSPEDKLEQTALISYDSVFVNGNGSVKLATVISVESSPGASGGAVVLEGGEKIDFKYPHPGNELLASFKEWRKTFENSKGIAIVGGGSVALGTFPSQSCIDYLLAYVLPISQNYRESFVTCILFRKDVEKRWRKRGIRFIFNDQIDDHPDGDFSTLKTAKGKIFEADTLVFARGGNPNTSFLLSLGKDVLDSQGYVKIAPTLQLAQHPNIFAAGDIISFNEQKALAKIPGHAVVVSANILNLISGKSRRNHILGHLKVYSSQMERCSVMLPPKRSTRSSASLSTVKRKETVAAVLKKSTDTEDKLQLTPDDPLPSDINDGISSDVVTTPAFTRKRFSPNINTDSVRRKTRRKLTEGQRCALEKLATFESNPTLQTRRALADELGLELKVVSVWFQNKRRPVNKAQEDADRLDSQVTDSHSGRREVLRDATTNASVNALDFSANAPSSTPVHLHGHSLSGLWNLLPSSSPERQRHESTYFSDGSIPDAAPPAKLGKRPSLEWACKHERRVVKRARTSIASAPKVARIQSPHSPHMRQRTDMKPRRPSPSLFQKGFVIQTGYKHSQSLQEGLCQTHGYEKDVLDVALALMQLKGQKPPSACASF
ncbi:hypothetical protein EW145_g972 [Phellinidium pouzarii]|uniref:Homeobox domain-containing protein n=1 Tax=Phellinidium pouzarii TaxID=167371 RepID=A0A4S4LGW4_9AGAM|nr:hypothetical protein EW145_g972 [Phellinidium pouzarii]